MAGKWVTSWVVVTAVALSVSTLEAAPLGLQLNAAPDIFSSFIDVSYDATSDTLSASGFALNIDDDGIGPPHAIVGGLFSLTAPIDGTGALGVGGTISITGTVPTLGMTSGTLLTGTITEFGFKPAGGDPLEFRFDVTGGDVASVYGSARGGIILSASGFTGSFTSDFDNLSAAEANSGAGAADTAPAREPMCRSDASDKGSLLFFSKVEIKWSADGRTLLQDTFLTFTNDAPGDVNVQAFFIAGDRPIEELCADPLCDTLIQEFEPGWNTADCRFTLTGNQAHSWSASRGSTKCQAFSVLDAHGPGRLDPETANTTRILRGYVVAWAVKFNAQAPNTDGRGLYENIRWNHLQGSGLIVNYEHASAWEYNAWAFRVCDPVIGHGESVGTPDQLLLDGIHYTAPYDSLLFDFYGSTTGALGSGTTAVTVDTDLTVHPVDLDLRQDGCGPVLTKVEATIWNEFEAKFSGTRRCVCCWDQTMLGQWSPSVAIPNHFRRSTLRTDRGKARLNGVKSTECDYETECGIPPAMNAQCVSTAVGFGGAYSQDTPLLGLATKFLSFAGQGLATVETSGLNLVGLGEEPARIVLDVMYGPFETTEDAPSGRRGLGDSMATPKQQPGKTPDAPRARSDQHGRGN